MSLSGLKLDEADDEFFGTLESRSNLANLFGTEPQAVDSNQSLKYKPPKQQIQNTVEPSKAWNVKAARVVNAFKLINQSYIPQGRVGLAVLSNAQNDYRVIIYRTKTNVLATKTLLSGMKLIFTLSYLQFQDDLQEFWSVFLDSADEKSILDYLPPDCVSSEVTEQVMEPAAKVEPVKISEPTKKTEVDPPPVESHPSTKAKLLSRMAKMGQPLPKLTTPQTTTDMSDSSDTEVINIPPKPSILPRKVTKSLVSVGSAVPSSSLVTYAAPIQETQYMNMLLTENRTQNTEIRMNLSKLETKIEKVLDKIELLGSDDGQKSNRRDKDDEILSLEEKILELRKENRSLRQNARELETRKVVPERRERKWRVDDDDEEFDEVLTRLGIQLDDCKGLGDDKMELLEKAIFKMTKVDTDAKRNEQKLAESSKEIKHLNETIAILQNEMKDRQDVEQKAATLASENKDLVEQLRAAKTESKDLKEKAATLANENKDLVEQLSAAKTESKDSLQATVKQIMNNLYADIATTVETAGDTLSKDAVLRLCGNALRKQTMNAFKGNAA